MSRLIGLLGQGVGLAAEYRQHRAQQNSQQKNSRNPDQARNPFDVDNEQGPGRPRTPLGTSNLHEQPQHELGRDTSYTKDYNGYSSVDQSDSDREFDKANRFDDPPSYEEIEKTQRTSDDLAREVLDMSNKRSTVYSSFSRKPLPCPVIIPQRRPGSKDRGFMRAYAPLLGECAGIDQETFLSFLKNFHKSTQASPIFGIVQVSAGIAGFAPSVIATVVTTAAGAAAEKGAEMQKVSRTNGFLDKMNNELFIPAGLFAMIVQYQPYADENSMLGRVGVSGATTELDTTQTIANRMGGSSQGNSFSRQNLGVASGASTTMPEAAPLVYPEERSANSGQPETFKDKTRDFKKFMGGYMDRKAQAKFASQNPGSNLALPEQHTAFKSKYSEPNHPMYNGGLVGLVSGGQLSRNRSRSPRPGNEGFASPSDNYLPPDPRFRQFDDKNARRDYERQARREDKHGGRGRDERRRDEGRRDEGRRDEDGKERKSMKEGVLYLMIVNMPSEFELARANRQVEYAGRSL